MGDREPAANRKTIDERFDEVAVAFAEVKVAFAEQRDFTLFSFDKLGRELRQEFRQGLEDVRSGLRQTENRLTRRLDNHDVILAEILGEVRALRGEMDRRG